MKERANRWEKSDHTSARFDLCIVYVHQQNGAINRGLGGKMEVGHRAVWCHYELITRTRSIWNEEEPQV